ncbi:MAG: HNH endonuclease signature motif containing protein [Mariniphaga sp.]
MKRYKWTTEAIEVLIELYANYSASEIASRLNCHISRIYFKAHKLRLKKSDEFKKSVNSGRILKLSTTGALLRFQPGHETWNKGKKMSDYLPEQTIKRIQSYQFTKGNKPMNYKPIGSTRVDVDGYHQTKFSDKPFWAYTHHLVWIEHNGPIPKGMNIMFSDGNRSNCNIANLVLKTKAECMAQNTIRRYPEDLQKSILLLKKAERIISSINQ